MENYKIIEIIKEIKRGDMSNFQAIYDVFSRLINYYGKKIGEDGCGDITLFFMELLYSVDTDKFYPDESDAMNRYIAVSLRNYYIALSKKADIAMKCSDELFEDSAKYFFEPEEALSLKDGL